MISRLLSCIVSSGAHVSNVCRTGAGGARTLDTLGRLGQGGDPRPSGPACACPRCPAPAAGRRSGEVQVEHRRMRRGVRPVVGSPGFTPNIRISIMMILAPPRSSPNRAQPPDTSHVRVSDNRRRVHQSAIEYVAVYVAVGRCEADSVERLESRTRLSRQIHGVTVVTVMTVMTVMTVVTVATDVSRQIQGVHPSVTTDPGP